MNEATRSQIDGLVKNNRVVLFMKGSRHFPQCGFSATVAKILDGYLPKYETVNVLSSAEIRDGIKEYSSWPTIPQLYIDGKFVGGCDIVKELDATGELGKLLGSEKAPPPKVEPPTVKVTDEAKKAILAAQKEAGGDPLRVAIGPRHDYDLFFEAKEANDVAVDVDGITFVFDPESAGRAGELSISMVEGTGFRIDSSKAPPRPKSMSAAELKKALETDAKKVYVLDVRSPAEQKLAAIPGGKALEPSTLERELADLPSDVRVVVYCHSGHRSRGVAEQLVARGVKNVFNLEGGIDAYSGVDSSVPRY